MLILSRRAGESLIINQDIEVKITEINGDRVKIGISAPRHFKIMRKEVCQTRESNIQAAQITAPKAELLTLMAALEQKEKEQTKD